MISELIICHFKICCSKHKMKVLCVRVCVCAYVCCACVFVRACVCVLHSINRRVVSVVLVYGGYGGAREGGGLLWFSKNNISEDICIIQVRFLA